MSGKRLLSLLREVLISLMRNKLVIKGRLKNLGDGRSLSFYELTGDAIRQIQEISNRKTLDSNKNNHETNKCRA